ncbi:MAG: hypothetical protein AAF383_09625 [Cyanobacteria bacterium P01_A01_bin.83]
MLNFFNNLPFPIKVFLGFFAAGLIFAGFISLGDLTSLFEAKNDDLVVVQLLVQTEDNQPIQDAKIQFISKGSPTTKYTTASGYTEIEIPARESVEINITKDNYETLVEIINLLVDKDTNKKFKLKNKNLSSQLPDYQYYTAQNEVFLLNLAFLSPDLNVPIIKKALKYIGIDKIPLVAQNAVFRNIEKFKRESGNKKTIQENIDSGLGFEVSGAEQKKSTSLLVNQETGVKEYKQDYKLSDTPGEDGLCNFGYAPVLGSFQTANDNSKYTAFIKKNNLVKVIQYPKLSDLAKYGQKDYEYLGCIKSLKDFWIQKVIENNQDVRGFLGFYYPLISDLESYNQGCKDYWELERISPSPYVKFLDVINDNQEPIRIESITYQYISKNPYQLTVADQRNVLFQSGSDITQEFNVSLRPANHFLIPIEFGFNTEPIKEIYQFESDIDKSTILNVDKIYVTKALSRSEWERIRKATAEQTNKIGMTSVNLSEEFINNASSLEELFNLIPRRFAVGSILNVKSIRINGQNININPPNDEPTVYISTFIQAGSCPYLVVYDLQQNGWLELGTILYARNNKSLQQEELHNLGNNISRIRIEERESEITYIDALSIVYTEPNMEEVQEVIYPIAELQKVDEDYFLLHKGEALEIDLERFVPTNASNVKLKINGYYKVLQGELS